MAYLFQMKPTGPKHDDEENERHRCVNPNCCKLTSWRSHWTLLPCAILAVHAVRTWSECIDQIPLAFNFLAPRRCCLPEWRSSCARASICRYMA